MTDEEQERAAIREYDGGLDRKRAETMARRASVDPQWHLKMKELQRMLGISAVEKKP